MLGKTLLNDLMYVEMACATCALIALIRSKSVREYWPLFLLISAHLSTAVISLVLFASTKVLGPSLVYRIYYYVYWLGFGTETVGALLSIYKIFRSAMAPLKGLESLGILVFRWAASISAIVAFAVSISPHVNAEQLLMMSVTEMQRACAILTLSLLLFVCFAIRPMGLSYRSRVFGVSIGLGILSTLNVVHAQWLGSDSSLFTFLNIAESLVVCSAFVTWAYYFFKPEPKRRMILLPTTSPFLRWNQISELLGHNPGYVAVGTLPPDTFAPAEMEIMRRASAKMSEHKQLAPQTAA